MRNLAGELRGALERGEIFAEFQPQVDLASGTIVAAEALCRWTHPRWGAIPPVEFITVAEDEGLIEAIGEFMAEECCKAMAIWSSFVRPFDVSVNVSPVQLQTDEFSVWLAECLKRHPPRGGTFTLEITETRSLGDIGAVVGRLEAVREIGVGVAIDDYGVGYSSLSQIHQLQGTEVKLDRSLVADQSPKAAAMMAEVIEIAHASDMRVVAEGVETDDDLARVTALGCDRAQGYLIGRPMSQEKLTGLIGAA